MKRNLLLAFLLISSICSTSVFAQSKLIHYWHFNNAVVPSAMYTDSAGGIHGIAADYSLIDTSKAKVLYYKITGTSAVYHTYIDFYAPAATEYDTINMRMGQSTGNAIKARNPSDSMELRFYIPTTNYKNIVLKYASEASSRTSGQLLQDYSFSLDSGSTWHSTGMNMTADSAGLTYNLISLSFDTTVNNNSKLVFRIIFNGNTSGTSGNNRFDNITIEGDTITAATTNFVSGPGNITNEPVYTLYPNPVENTLEISAALDGTKSVMIYNAEGKSVFAGLAAGKGFSINVAGLSSGMYFVSIRENATGLVTTERFIKK